MSIKNIKLTHSPLSDNIYIYRHGKDPALALEKRVATADVMMVLVDYMMHNAPKGSVNEVMVDGQSYTIKVTPTPEPPA